MKRGSGRAAASRGTTGAPGGGSLPGGLQRGPPVRQARRGDVARRRGGRAAALRQGREGRPRRHAGPVRHRAAAGADRPGHARAALPDGAAQALRDGGAAGLDVDHRRPGGGDRAGTDAGGAVHLPTGRIRQRPPAYSAVKVGGRRAYALARAGEAVEIPEREVEVARFDQLWRDGERAAFAIECSSGTYVRSLIADLGDAYCLELRRTAIGPFDVAEAERFVALDDALGVPARGRAGRRGRAPGGPRRRRRRRRGRRRAAARRGRPDRPRRAGRRRPSEAHRRLPRLDGPRLAPRCDHRPRRLAVGEFDGVHAGHREVIRGADSVLTFEPHPRTVVAPAAAPKLLTTLEQKTDLIGALGVEELIVIPFDGSFSAQTAQEFIDHVLVGEARRHLGVGGRELPLRQQGARRRRAAAGPGRVRDPRGGDGRAGGRDRLLLAHPRAGRHGRRGERPARLLGAPFELRGIVAHGDKRGRTLGFPTANLVPDPAHAVPDHGIYATRAIVPGLGEWMAATSIGVRPTFVTGRGLLVEAFLLDFDGRSLRPRAAAGVPRAHPRRAPLRVRRRPRRADARGRAADRAHRRLIRLPPGIPVG